MSTRRSKKPSTGLVHPDDPTLLPSDDEDEDFVVPLSDGGGSDSSDSASDDERPKKKSKGNQQAVVEEPQLSKEDVDDIWASFNAPSASTSTTNATASSSTKSASPPMVAAQPAPKKMIKITVEYKFVGETVTQEKEVAEDSEEAKIWLATQSSKGKEKELFPDPDPVPSPTATSTATSNPTPTETSLPPKQPPPKRRNGGGGGLIAMAASLNKKSAKLNTLEKSKLDWNKFVEKESITEDLSRARKDGYLEKQDFLQRTEDAREDALEKSKNGRR